MLLFIFSEHFFRIFLKIVSFCLKWKRLNSKSKVSKSQMRIKMTQKRPRFGRLECIGQLYQAEKLLGVFWALLVYLSRLGSIDKPGPRSFTVFNWRIIGPERSIAVYRSLTQDIAPNRRFDSINDDGTFSIFRIFSN